MKPRILFVVMGYPWPPHGGYQLRNAVMLEGLSEVADVHVLAIDDAPGRRAVAAPPVRLSQVDVVAAPIRHNLVRVLRWITGHNPRALAWRDWSGARTLLAARKTSYDLAWYAQSEAAQALSDVVSAPTVVDIDDLQSIKIAHRRSTRFKSGYGLRSIAVRIADRIDEKRWAILQAKQAAACVAVVCSELDRRRIGGNAVVIPNSYPAPSPAECSQPRDGAIGMVGVFSYEPNRTGATLFSRSILPLIRAQCPHANFRLIGRNSAAVSGLTHLPGVTIVGEVPDTAAELRRCRLAVVPLVTGGGTRIKILEAFASGVPVVSTSVGCEGIDAVDGEHLLVADDPATFAASCIELLSDAALRSRLAKAAQELYLRKYQASCQRSAAARTALTVISKRHS